MSKPKSIGKTTQIEGKAVFYRSDQILLTLYKIKDGTYYFESEQGDISVEASGEGLEELAVGDKVILEDTSNHQGCSR